MASFDEIRQGTLFEALNSQHCGRRCLSEPTLPISKPFGSHSSFYFEIFACALVFNKNCGMPHGEGPHLCGMPHMDA